MKPAALRILPRSDYREVWALQKDLVEARRRDAIPDTLILVEHPHVITLGRRKESPAHVHDARFPVVEIERGGDVTYHGPGQLVGYPILKLEGAERDLHAYLRALEETLIVALHAFGLAGERKPEWTGVWLGGEPAQRYKSARTAQPEAVAGFPPAGGMSHPRREAGGPEPSQGSGQRKIASLGIAVRHWVTMHGFALNVCTDLSAFDAIDPCGLPSAVMTSMARELARDVTLAEVIPHVAAAFAATLARELA